MALRAASAGQHCKAVLPSRNRPRRCEPCKAVSAASDADKLSRRGIVLAGVALTLLAGRQQARAADDAAQERGDAPAADAAWTRAIAAAPSSSAALSNRGTARLQAGRWADALADLDGAVRLDEARGAAADALTLNNRGNARGALGNWAGAIDDFLQASRDPRLLAIARANYALALFESGDSSGAASAARGLLRRDPEFWDMRAALAAVLWAEGREAEAEAQWVALCSSGRGFGAPASAEAEAPPRSVAYSAALLRQQLALIGATVAGLPRGAGDDTPCALYGSTARVAGRWPPRATAALDAFLAVSRTGRAVGYDGKPVVVEFGAAQPPKKGE